jgi:putative peptidoglycan lipid II flippase
VVLTTALGYLAALRLPGWIGVDPKIGVAGLTASAGIAGWVEFYLLRRALGKQIGSTGVAPAFMVKLWGSALLAAAVAWGVKLGVTSQHRVLIAIVILLAYGVSFLLIATLLKIPEASAMTSRLRRSRGRST